MKLNKFLLLSLFMPTISFAMFCPTNFNLIDIGDTIEKVDQACGPPDSKETKETDKNVPQEWSYYIPQTVGTGTSYQQEGTLKTTITFDDKGKAINISVNGIGVGASTICGKSIQLGDTRESIQATCGKPSFINKQQPSSDQPEKDTTITYQYNSTPPATLIFVNGVLTENK